jgi:hypothetical protein
MKYLLPMLMLLALSAGAEQAVLAPVADATIYAENDNQGNGAGEFFFAGKNGAGYARRGLLRFDIADAIAGGAVIQSVTLTATVGQASVTGNAVTLYPLLEAWGEGISNPSGNEGGGTAATAGDPTWTYRVYDTENWTSPGGTFDDANGASITINSSGVYTWPSSPALVAAVQQWLDNPASNHGWIVIGDESQAATAKQFSSRSGDTPPVLTVDYEPPAPLEVEQVSPAFVDATEGQEVVLAVQASGGQGSFHYTWYFDNGTAVNTVGEDSATLILSDIQRNQTGTYFCEVTDGSQSVASATFNVTVALGVPVQACPLAVALAMLAATRLSRRSAAR